MFKRSAFYVKHDLKELGVERMESDTAPCVENVKGLFIIHTSQSKNVRSGMQEKD